MNSNILGKVGKFNVVAHKALFNSHVGVVLFDEFVETLDFTQVIDANLSVKQRERGYRESESVLALIYSLVLGGSCLADLDVLRGDAGTLSLIGVREVLASQTAGEFLRKFSIGDIWSLQRVGKLLQSQVRARQSQKVCTIDFDGSLYEQQSKRKQGSKKAYNGKYAYQPLFAFWEEEEEIVFSHLLAGSTRASSKAKWFLEQTLRRVPCGAAVKLRADGEFYVWELIEYLEAKRVSYAISAHKNESMMEQIERIDERKWKRSKYYPQYYPQAEVAEFRYGPKVQPVRRYVVKRERAEDKRGRKYYRYHCFVTNDETTRADKLMKWQLGRCQAENLIKEHKSGFSLERLPTRLFQANWAYLLIGSLAYNLDNWFKKLVLPKKYARVTVKTIRHRIMNLAGRIVRTGGRYYLVLSDSYKYQTEWRYTIRQLAKLKSAYP